MKLRAKKLFAVRSISHTGGLIKPNLHLVIGTDKVVRRIVLAPSIEDALLLTYPSAYKDVWRIAKFKAYVIEPESRHPIKTPSFLEKGFDFKLATEFEEHACFSNLRMTEVGIFKVKRDSKQNTDLIDNEGNIYGKRYALF